MMDDTKQEWQYHGNKPIKGRKLLLLQQSELVLALPLIFRLIPKEQILKRLAWFESSAGSESQFLEISKLLSLVTRKRKQKMDFSVELEQLNLFLNQYFSDYGWRMVRKELAQIKKRKKKSHIELSNDLVYRLKAFMSLKQLDSFDQALDFLLSEVEHIETNVEHKFELADS
ncbi:Conserved hypothetical protein [Shewanella piezotolerans WP3]|uniref:Uncharacterized protein n=1 Tax=Shewanella piezotolerans (strain WP3 / JCM 13877) TaxID=225849 RepID=B8CP18_SHEPW|nr:hypothetical protein [Shewanella piezotolerans]ACJ29262.1 Conserved hypothetical protein [Shewanella piezotolerans WP3]